MGDKTTNNMKNTDESEASESLDIIGHVFISFIYRIIIVAITFRE